MKHFECRNYVNLDCDKGMCAITKAIVPMDGEGSDACGQFVQAPFCKNCSYFKEPNEYGVGTCTGLEKENWAFATCAATTCTGYKGN